MTDLSCEFRPTREIVILAWSFRELLPLDRYI